MSVEGPQCWNRITSCQFTVPVALLGPPVAVFWPGYVCAGVSFKRRREKESTKTCDEHPEEQGLVFLVVLQHPLEVLLLPLDGHLATQLGLGPQRRRGRLSSWCVGEGQR